jgi:transposase
MQISCFPDTLDDYIKDNNPVRFLDAFVDRFDIKKAGFQHTTPAIEGRPGFDPRVLVKLYIYGYFYKIRSSRKLMVECGRNVELMWLLGKLIPDFRTIAAFRKNNAKAIKALFREFVHLCSDLNLFKGELVAIDGSKFRAVNSKDNNLTESKLEDKFKRIDAKLDEYFAELDKCDEEEVSEDSLTKEELQEKIDALNTRKDFYNECQKTMKEQGETQISFTDPDSRLMKVHNGGFDVSYNVQTAVDAKSHMILDFNVTNNANDMGLLCCGAMMAKEATGAAVLEVVADCGYEKKEDLLECLNNGIIPTVSLKKGDSISFDLAYENAEITPETRASTDTEDIKKCLASGVLPEAYEGKNIEVEVVSTKVERVSDEKFTLNEDGKTVTCPNGMKLFRTAWLAGKAVTRFVCRSACSHCDNKCTTAKFKQVDLKDGQKELNLNKVHTEKKVRIKLTPDKKKIKLRKCVVEHPFGTVKRALDGSYLLMKGKIKTTAEMSLSFLAYNMKRAINMIGVKELIAKMG